MYKRQHYAQGMLPARVDFVEPLGSHVLVTALVDDARVIVQAPAGTHYDPGTRIGLEPSPERMYFFDRDTGDVRADRERISL